MIEILDFSLIGVVYKNIDLVRRNKPSDEVQQNEIPASGPTFKHIYNRLFGPTYAGEYLPPVAGQPSGTYVLSYPGIAFTFPIKHKSWSDKVDFVSILSSNAAGPAMSMAIFSGNSWTEARSSLYTKPSVLPRSPALSAKSIETVPDEVEEVRVLGGGRLEFVRRSTSAFIMVLNETTPQDLVAELGPPDAIYRKHDRRISIHATGNTTKRRQPSISPGLDPQSLDTDQSSIQSYTEDSDMDADAQEGRIDDRSDECFYNYFQHGLDILISLPHNKSPAFPGSANVEWPTSSSAQLVVSKIFLHGNIPGSFSFNRHRRSRWVIKTSGENRGSSLTSEMGFSEISNALREVWHETYEDAEQERQMQRGMVLNRGWAESPESSIELLGDFEEISAPDKGDDQGTSDGTGGLNNTELFGFPGLLFEVLKNNTVSCLTVF